jgi:hypothetical protein
MRVFTDLADPHSASPSSLPKTGIRTVLERTRGTLTAPINGKIMHVMEKRFAVAVKSTTRMALPIFTIVNLTDYADDYVWSDPLAGDWEAAGIQAWSGGAGLAAFAFRIRTLCGVWAKDWARELDELDGLLKVDVRLPHPFPYVKAWSKR